MNPRFVPSGAATGRAWDVWDGDAYLGSFVAQRGYDATELVRLLGAAGALLAAARDMCDALSAREEFLRRHLLHDAVNQAEEQAGR